MSGTFADVEWRSHPLLTIYGFPLNFIAVEMTRSGLEFERRLPDMRASSGGVRVRISSSGLLHLLLFPFSSFTSAQTFSISISHAFSLPYGILPLKPSRFATLTPHLDLSRSFIQTPHNARCTPPPQPHRPKPLFILVVRKVGQRVGARLLPLAAIAAPPRPSIYSPPLPLLSLLFLSILRLPQCVYHKSKRHLKDDDCPTWCALTECSVRPASLPWVMLARAVQGVVVLETGVDLVD